jgi:hypothetical protein
MWGGEGPRSESIFSLQSQAPGTVSQSAHSQSLPRTSFRELLNLYCSRTLVTTSPGTSPINLTDPLEHKLLSEITVSVGKCTLRFIRFWDRLVADGDAVRAGRGVRERRGLSGLYSCIERGLRRPCAAPRTAPTPEVHPSEHPSPGNFEL